MLAPHDILRCQPDVFSLPHLALLTESTFEEWMLGVYVDFTAADAKICYLHPPLQHSVKSSYNEILK